jgi:CheY-like chemotaxis protein
MILPRILVVDDQPHIARITRMMLEQAGKYEIATETRPAHVVDTVRRFAPHTIVLDYNMPGKTGAEVAREIWNDQFLQETGILFFCGLVPPKDASLQETARGPFRFISKMIPPKELLTAVDEMVSISAKTEPSSAA